MENTSTPLGMQDRPMTIELGSGTYVLTPLPNYRWHVYHRASGLQGSILRDGTDGPSWMSYDEMMGLALVARLAG